MRGAGMEPNSSTNNGDAQQGSMQDVQELRSRGSGEIMSDELYAVREDPNIYEDAKASFGWDRWVCAQTGFELQSLKEKLKQWMV